MFRDRPRRLSAVVAVLTLVITGALTYLTWRVNSQSEERLLDRQLAQVGTLLSNQAAVLQTELADIGQVAVNTNANPAAFARFADRELKQTGQSLSLWRIANGSAQQLAGARDAPLLPSGGARAPPPPRCRRAAERRRWRGRSRPASWRSSASCPASRTGSPTRCGRP